MTTLPTDYQTFIATSRYARWLDEEKRRETWGETVTRYVTNIVKPVLSKEDFDAFGSEITDSILNLRVLPSMRAMMTASGAGGASDRDNTCMYNCSYLSVCSPIAFDEAMFILLCGTGVGFSVEKKFISKLPFIPTLEDSDTTIVVRDSKEGWAKGLRQLIALLYSGEIPKWDVSKIRPAGSRLKTFGGRASGPAPLVELFNFVVDTFKKAQTRQLESLECHDIMTMIGSVVVVGGVRRSATISLSDLSDDQMRYAKSGDWWTANPHRGLANNSAVYETKPDSVTFLREWLSLVESKSGERGIFNRQAAKTQVAKNGRRDANYEFGCNPCSEILLRNGGVCNLSEVVVREGDTIDTLEQKVRIATILGTVQATYTKFPYLRKMWKDNADEERLLGVSLTGVMDNPLTTTANKSLHKTLSHLKNVSIQVNKEWAKKLGINQATAITCNKPSGTVSQLCAPCASGIHPQYAPYYIRTVRGDNKDSLTRLLKDQGVPNAPCEVGVRKGIDTTTVFSFPMKAPTHAVVTADVTAIDQLKMWLAYQRHWCEHKPSVTINVRENEWIEVGNFVYEHFDEMSGVSFLPFDAHTYVQAPYTGCDKAAYEDLLSQMPSNINWAKLSEYEEEDNTKGSQELACSGDTCEIVDI